MRGGLALALLGLTACGRLGFDARVEPDEPGDPIDGSLPDFEADAGSFGNVMPVDELDEPGVEDEDPSLTGDLREIFFRSTRDGDGDIYRAVRDSPDDPFGTPERVDALSTDADEVTPEISVDGLTIYFGSSREGSAGIDVWWSRRESRDAPWDPPMHVTESAVPGAEFSAVRDAAELHGIYTRRGILNADLFVASRAAVTDPWGEFARITELRTGAYDGDAALDPDGVWLAFASDREGGVGGFDLWQSRRAAVDQPFEEPTLISELATAAGERDPWISPDLRVLYFVRDEGDGAAIVYATR